MTEKFKTITLQGIKLKIGNQGTVIKVKTNRVLSKQINKRTGYVSLVIWNEAKQKVTTVYHHRLLAQAFLGLNPRSKMQVDHIDNNRANNDLSNLRVLNRKENNSTKHAKKAKSQNHRHTSHKGFIVIAKKDGQTLKAKNGNRMSKLLHCSHVLVYDVLNENHYQKTAKGWTLEFVKEDSINEM